MSLINDALKRAKAAQQPTADSPASELHFRPTEPAQRVRRSLGLFLPLGFGLVALLLLLAVWYWSNRHSAEVFVRAKIPAQSLTTEPAAQPAPLPTQPSQPEPAAVPDSHGATTTPPLPNSEPAGNAGQTLASETQTNLAGADVATNSVLAAPPVPAAPRLKGIVYNGSRSSVVINGKTLFIGDRISEYRVTAIGPESATLVGAGKTNILTLEE